jgi:mannan polymerase complexes MNN9 subunit
MPYFDMRQPRSSNRTYLLALILGITGLYFLYSISSSSALDPTQLVRQRKSDAAAANPLSPPTSAFRKQSNEDGVQRPPPVVHYQLNNLTADPHPERINQKILILTPLARFYPDYWANLLKLSYPHEHISLGFITPKTKEGDAATTALQEAIKVTQSGPEDQRFQSITILRQDFEPPLQSQDEAERHKMENQKKRRAAMARARNSLLFTTIGPSTSWVLWLDSDIVESPPTLIQDLASHDRAIIVPNCFQRFTNEQGKADVRPYDYNSWRDSDVAQNMAKEMDPDDVLFEGYAEMPTYRTLMAMLANKDDPNPDTQQIMPLDGVGGTALLVKAEVHRDGAMFPPFAFYHLIETEGFAKMAKRLGYESWGLPNYFVYHYNE